VRLGEALADHFHGAVFFEALDGAHLFAGHRSGERDAGAHRLVVDQDRAGAAHPVLAAKMRAGEMEPVAQEVGERHPVLDLGRDRLAVHFDVFQENCSDPFFASAIARMTMVRWSWNS